MKRLIICLSLVFSFGLYATAQDSISNSTKSSSGYNPFAGWSLSLKTGGTYFRCTPEEVTKIGIGGSIKALNVFQGQVEYAFNPVVALGGEFTYLDYGRNYISGASTGSFTAQTFDAIAYGTINFSKLVPAYNTKCCNKLNVYGKFGAGLGFYGFNYPTNFLPANNGITLLSVTGLVLEYNVSKSLAISLEGQYRSYDKPSMAGVTLSTTRDDAFVGLLGLTYKFNAEHQEKHMKNIGLKEYVNPEAVKDAVVYRKIDELAQADERIVSETNKRFVAIEQDNTETKGKVSKLRDDLTGLAAKAGEAKVNVSFEEVEFEVNSNKLEASSFGMLDQIASLLINNTTWSSLIISGHTDNTGSSAFNQKLSAMRAETVKDYLESKGVKIKITTVGYGSSRPVKSNNTPEGRKKNRRVAFEFSK